MSEITIQTSTNEKPVDPPANTMPVECAYMDVQCHIVIKDITNGVTLLDKRG